MKPQDKLRVLPLLAALAWVAGCSDPAPGTSDAGPSPVAEAPAAAPITDEAGLRTAAAKALSAQRFYAPAGDSALDHYLALRTLRPDDANVATALLELLPYAVIGTEQAVVRQDFAEARRLLALLERADPQAPSLGRLRDGIAVAEASAQAAADEALAQAERDEATRLAAERESQAAAALPPAVTASAPETVAGVAPAAPPAVGPPSPAAATSPASAVARAPAPAPVAPVAAPPAAPSAAPAASAGATPRLISAPSPRYPLMALRRKLEGQVTVQFTIQPDGSVASPRVVSGDPPGVFDEAALVAASRWRFEAGSQSVASTRVVQFRLAEGQR